MADSSEENFVKAFEGLKENPKIQAFLKVCATNFGGSDSPVTTIIFPGFKEDSPDIEALAEFLWLQAINYVIPLRKRKQAGLDTINSSTGGDLSGIVRLQKATKNTFVEFNKKYPQRASEIGELLAYLIALEFLNAPQIASKMALKTSGNMLVHGLDGIHASFNNGIMTLYFLEAKLSGSANDGVKDYAESTSDFGSNRKQYLLEYNICSDLGNLDSLDSVDRDTAMAYLDIYGDKKSERLERSIGVICYSEIKHYKNKIPKNNQTPPSAHEKHFKTNLETELSHHRLAANKHLVNYEIDPNGCEVFFIAFPDINKIREAFYECMYG